MVREYVIDGEQISGKDELKNFLTEGIGGHWVLNVCFAGLLLESPVGSAGLIGIKVSHQAAGGWPFTNSTVW